MMDEMAKNRRSITTETFLVMMIELLASKFIDSSKKLLDESELDILKYINITESFQNIKDKMTIQAQTQIKFWKESLQDEVTFKSLVDLSNEIDA